MDAQQAMRDEQRPVTNDISFHPGVPVWVLPALWIIFHWLFMQSVSLSGSEYLIHRSNWAKDGYDYRTVISLWNAETLWNTRMDADTCLCDFQMGFPCYLFRFVCICPVEKTSICCVFGSFHLSLCLSVCLSLYRSIYHHLFVPSVIHSIYLSFYLCHSMSVCLSVCHLWKSCTAILTIKGNSSILCIGYLEILRNVKMCINHDEAARCITSWNLNQGMSLSRPLSLTSW